MISSINCASVINYQKRNMYYIRKFFYWFYPSRPKLCFTKQGESLRFLMFWLVLSHMVFALVSLAKIGFTSMIMQITWTAWAYSTYLTLREAQILVYLASLLAGFAFLSSDFFGEGELQKDFLFSIIELVFIGIYVYFLCLKYWAYRQAGGIKGHSHKANKVMGKIAVVGQNLYNNRPQTVNTNLAIEDDKRPQLREALLNDAEAGYDVSGRPTLAITEGPAHGEYEDPAHYEQAPDQYQNYEEEQYQQHYQEEPYVDPREYDRPPPSRY